MNLYVTVHYFCIISNLKKITNSRARGVNLNARCGFLLVWTQLYFPNYDYSKAGFKSKIIRPCRRHILLLVVLFSMALNETRDVTEISLINSVYCFKLLYLTWYFSKEKYTYIISKSNVAVKIFTIFMNTAMKTFFVK